MRRHVGLAFLLVLLGLVAACASSLAGASSSGPKVEPAPTVDSYAGGPRLVFDNKSIDFGAVPFNKEVKASFQVRNVGDQKLTIGKVDTKIVQGC